MTKTKIRFIDWTRTGKTGGVGIYGLSNKESETGEYQIGDELEIDGEVPAGWLPKVEILSAPKSKDAEFVTGAPEGDRGTESKDEADQPRRGRPRNDA